MRILGNLKTTFALNTDLEFEIDQTSIHPYLWWVEVHVM